MLKLNIHSLSQKFCTEQMMRVSVQTNINVHDFSHFEFFLDSSGLDKVRIGFYEKRTMWDLVEKFVVYEIPEDEDTQGLITFLTLTHGSLEKAYREFRDELEKKISIPTIGYGY